MLEVRLLLDEPDDREVALEEREEELRDLALLAGPRDPQRPVAADRHVLRLRVRARDVRRLRERGLAAEHAQREDPVRQEPAPDRLDIALREELALLGDPDRVADVRQ